MANVNMTIGILAIQGSVIEHRRALEKLGVSVSEVRLPNDLNGIDGIIIPGGESTTISKLMKRFGLFDELKKRISDGLPAWGTCAGAILLAKKVTGKNPPPTLEVMDIEVSRNAYGGQLQSFVTDLSFKLETRPFDKLPSDTLSAGRSKFEKNHRSQIINHKLIGIFIRAPKIRLLPKSDVEVLAECDGEPVMIRERNMFVTSFHPELTEDVAIHEYFLDMCK